MRTPSKVKMPAKKKTIGGVILDAIIYAILIVALFFIVLTAFAQSQDSKRIPSVFGYSLVMVLSGSMTDGGFDIGDKVFVKKVKANDIKVGDVVVYYKISANEQVFGEGTELEDISNEEYVSDELNLNGRMSTDDAISTSTALIFHRVMAIFRDQYGVRFYELKGDSNNTEDLYKVREDLVIARYVESPGFVTAFLKFSSTPVGMVVCIGAPVLLLILMELRSFIFDLKGNLYAQKLMSGEYELLGRELSEYDVVPFLTVDEKLLLFDIEQKKNKMNAVKYLWGDVWAPDLNLEEKRFANEVLEGLDRYKIGRPDFWEYWLKLSNWSEKKNILFREIQANLIVDEKKNIQDAEEEAYKIFKEKKRSDGFKL